jgi:hypothetical protein
MTNTIRRTKINPSTTQALLLAAMMTGALAVGTAAAATDNAGPAASAWSEALSPAFAAQLEKAAASPGYAKASAHNPNFADKTLWPMLTGKEAYVNQVWPKARLLVWAQPGQSGAFGSKNPNIPDPTDPKNWIEDGKPCEKVVLDENTDLLFPASDKPYSVGFRGSPMNEFCRHVTIEAGAAWTGGGDGAGRRVAGCIWVKKGGGMYAQGATRFLGNGSVFVRNDNLIHAVPGNRRANLHCFSQYFSFNKTDGASVEFLGKVTVLDEFMVSSLVIVGPDSRLQPGRSAAPVINKGGALALMDGAYFGSWVNNFTNPDMQVIGGTIQGGLPERPLKRSAGFGLAFKNNSDAQYDGPGARISRGKLEQYGRVPALVLNPGSALRTFSANPATACLTFIYQPGGVGDKGACYVRVPIGSVGEANELKGSPDAAKRFAWFDALPRGTDIWFAKGVQVEGVTFDNLRKGGLMLADPADRKAWKDFTFGPGCLGKGDELFSVIEKLGRGCTY